ncbi:hypothetical protein CRG98_045135 [Punica granatum]|uniref:Uncharacterized protein n=1 Tax=Punica granatum TaxID=22663 RepID=A0A2I0HRX9_PUNGR|nr:hypothetical protein CRG98_045135 [Punica granatum]
MDVDVEVEVGVKVEAEEEEEAEAVLEVEGNDIVESDNVHESIIQLIPDLLPEVVAATLGLLDRNPMNN